MPTIVTDDRVVLCKISPVIRDAYEMRLCLYMAKTSGRSFVLQVPERARVEPALLLRIETHGGLVAEAAVSEYTVYFGALDAEGAEHDGWVLGDSSALEQLRGNLKSDQLKHALAPGAEWCGSELVALRRLLLDERFAMQNIDDEDVQGALLALFEYGEKNGGTVFAQ